MQTPIQSSRKLTSFGSTKKIVADSFLQTELKQKRQSHGFGDDVVGRSVAETSDMGHGRFNSGQVDQSSCAKKSSGLKCIAKQVIDIIRTSNYMSYPQVASIVVQMNLKSSGQVLQDYDEGLCS